jgi:hypothetical protein
MGRFFQGFTKSLEKNAKPCHNTRLR